MSDLERAIRNLRRVLVFLVIVMALNVGVTFLKILF